jgi:guanylate kinase
MTASREKDQADFDLERFIDMFDDALRSQDPRVIDALRSLMMMVILTKPESKDTISDRNHGPLRRLIEDTNNINRRLSRVEDEIRADRRDQEKSLYKYATTQASAQMAKDIDEELLKNIMKISTIKGL